MKKIIKGLILPFLFMTTLTGCNGGTKQITLHVDSFYNVEKEADGDVYIAQGLDATVFGQAVECSDKNKTLTVTINNDCTYREMYIDNLFASVAKYNKEGKNTYYDATIVLTYYGIKVCFADTLEGLNDYNVNWARKITTNDVWMRFFRP